MNDRNDGNRRIQRYAKSNALKRHKKILRGGKFSEYL